MGPALQGQMVCLQSTRWPGVTDRCCLGPKYRGQVKLLLAVALCSRMRCVCPNAAHCSSFQT